MPGTTVTCMPRHSFRRRRVAPEVKRRRIVTCLPRRNLMKADPSLLILPSTFSGFSPEKVSARPRRFSAQGQNAMSKHVEIRKCVRLEFCVLSLFNFQIRPSFTSQDGRILAPDRCRTVFVRHVHI